MAPEFLPFLAFIGLAILALVGLVVAFPVVLSARRKKELRVASAMVLAAVVTILLILLVLGTGIRQQFFLNEPFVTACGQGDLEEAQRLLARGASPDAYGIDFSETALIAASRYRRLEIVVLLLSKGAKVGLKDSHGKTALQWAEESGYIDIVRLLEQAEESQ